MPRRKRALITGITGQDGSYLAELLLKKKYEVVGMVRRLSVPNWDNIQHLEGKIKLVYGDLSDSVSLGEILKINKPDELYNLASQSHVGKSWALPLQTADITGLGALRLFEAVRQSGLPIKIYQASSSEMFGAPKDIPQTEETSLRPVNPYAAAKVFAHNMAHIYRESYQMFIACGILFNHESPRRGINFVTQKVALGAACAKLGIKTSRELNEEGEPIVKDGKVCLGNLEGKRDWGFAGDYVEAMWLILQKQKVDDYIICTGEIHTVRELCQEAFSFVGLDWQKYIKVDQRFVRPVETGPLVGDYLKAKKVLKWKPKTSFKGLVELMVEAHLARLR